MEQFSKTSPLFKILITYISPLTAKGILISIEKHFKKNDILDSVSNAKIFDLLQVRLKFFIRDKLTYNRAITELKTNLHLQASKNNIEKECIPIRNENDVMIARLKVKQVCQKIGFTYLDQIKISTAVSELVRNIVCYAQVGELEIFPIIDTNKLVRGLEIIAVKGLI